MAGQEFLGHQGQALREQISVPPQRLAETRRTRDDPGERHEVISGRWRRAGCGLDESAPGDGVNIGLTTLLLGMGQGTWGGGLFLHHRPLTALPPARCRHSRVEIERHTAPRRVSRAMWEGEVIGWSSVLPFLWPSESVGEMGDASRNQ